MGGGVGKLGGHEPGDLSDVVTACRECHAVQTKELAEARFAEGRKKRCALILSVLRANKGVGLTSKHLTWVLLRSKSPVLEDLKLLREKKFISRLKTGYYEISESGEHTLEKVEAQTRKAAGES
jgi:predicted transcriptional regulator